MNIKSVVGTVAVLTVISALAMHSLTSNANTNTKPQVNKDNLVGNFIVEGSTMGVASVEISNKTLVNFVEGTGGFVGLKVEKPFKDKDAIFTFNTIDKVCEFNNYESSYEIIKVNGVDLTVNSVCDTNNGIKGYRTLVLDYDGTVYMYMAMALAEIGGEAITAELDTGLKLTSDVEGYTKALTKIGG